MPRLNKRKRLLRELRVKAAEATREKKRQRIEGNMAALPEPKEDGARCSPPEPLPSTSHSPPPLVTTAAASSEEEEESLSSIRAGLMADEPPAEDQPGSDNEYVFITKGRLKEIVSSRPCSCGDGSCGLEYDEDGFDSTITVTCDVCDLKKISKPAAVTDGYHGRKDLYKTNVGLVYASIIDDFGLAGVRRLLGILGRPTIGTGEYYRYLRYIYNVMKDHYESQQSQVVRAIRKYYAKHTDYVPDGNGILNIDVSYDGTWMKPGHSSKIGLGLVIEVCTGFVVDFEILSEYCSACCLQEDKLKNQKITEEAFRTWKTRHAENCTKNYEGTSGAMEAEGAVRMFQRSEHHRFRYEHFVGDGDSSAFNAVKALNGGRGPYLITQVKKLECINHVQKRMGTRLRKLRDEAKVKIKTARGKTVTRSLFSGKTLSDKSINALTNSFGRAIRASVGKTTLDMEQAVMNTFHLVVNIELAGQNKIQGVYEALSSDDIMQRCLRGLTQNDNESFHSKLWARAHNTKFAGLSKLQFMARAAILDHNFGYERASLLKILKLGSPALGDSLRKQDRAQEK